VDWQLIPVFVALGCIVGFLAGLLGIGGAMTMIPILTVPPACRSLRSA
jgi:uncharacterized protein